MNKSLLFICTHNANRSQLAEGLAQHYYGQHFNVFSAGTVPSKIDPFAINVLADTNFVVTRR